MLYLALQDTTASKTSIGDIAKALGAPQPFLAKLLQDLARNGLIGSTKGPNGGFFANEHTAVTTVADIISLVDSLDDFHRCTMGMAGCSSASPCPLHHEVAACRDGLLRVFQQRSVGEMAQKVRLGQAVGPDFVQPQPQAMGTLSLAAAINMAGKLRMLSQRMAKACIFLACCDDAAIRQEMELQLSTGITLFGSYLERLGTLATVPTGYIQRLKKVQLLWISYVETLQNPASNEQAILILNQNTTLLSACNDVVLMLEDTIQRKSTQQPVAAQLGRKINQAGMQRMRSQRIALYYAAAWWGLLPGSAADIPELVATVQECGATLQWLMSEGYHTTEQDQQLALALRQWQALALTNTSGKIQKNTHPIEIMKGCDILLEYMDNITIGYVQLMDDIPNESKS